MNSEMKTSLWNCLVEARQKAVKAENEMLEKDGLEVVIAHRKAKIEKGKWELAWFEFCQL